MELIDKDALVAEIKERIETYNKGYANGDDRRADALEILLHDLNTIEVKEVDLDEAARKWEDKVYLEKGWQNEYGTPHAPFSEIGNAFREGAKFILKAQKGE